MEKLKLAVIVGIRSQFIKLAAFQLSVKAWNISNKTKNIKLASINSGQHYDHTLSAQYGKEYELDFTHDITEAYTERSPENVIATMIVELTKILKTINNIDYVIVFGDANTTLAGAIAAKQALLPLVHIESGLRSYDKSEPEECNRVVVDHLSDLHFVSCLEDQTNLEAEGISGSVFSGDIVRDLIRGYKSKIKKAVSDEKRALVTIHHNENLVEKRAIHLILHLLSERNYEVTFVAHPKVASLIEKWGMSHTHNKGNIDIVESLPHRRLLQRIVDSNVVVTDSGGIQREAYYLDKQILVLQKCPFWKSLTNKGFHRRIDSTEDSILEGLYWAENCGGKPPPKFNEFGSGSAGQKILDDLWEKKFNASSS